MTEYLMKLKTPQRIKINQHNETKTEQTVLGDMTEYGGMVLVALIRQWIINHNTSKLIPKWWNGRYFILYKNQ